MGRWKRGFAALFMGMLLVAGGATAAEADVVDDQVAAAVGGFGGTRLFARGDSGTLVEKRWNGRAWTGWSDFGGMQMTSGPSSNVRPDGKIDVFAKGPDNAIWHRYLDNGTWSAWGTIGGITASAPASAARLGTLNLDVVAKGGDDRFYHKTWEPTRGWSDWGSLDGSFLYAPAIISHESGKLDVFGVGVDHQLYQKHWNGSSWSGWMTLGGYLTSAPSVESQQSGQVDVFARDANNNVAQLSWNGRAWSSWGIISTIATSGPTAFSEGVGNVWLLVRGGPQLFINFLNRGTWTGWSPFGATAGTAGIPQEPRMPEDESFVREQSDLTIYYVAGGHKTRFASSAVATAAGVDLSTAVVVPDGTLTWLPEDDPITADDLQAQTDALPSNDASISAGGYLLMDVDLFAFYDFDRTAFMAGTAKWFRGRGGVASKARYIRRAQFYSDAGVFAMRPVGCIWARVQFRHRSHTISIPASVEISNSIYDSGYFYSCRRSGEQYPPQISLDGVGRAAGYMERVTVEICHSNTKADGPRYCGASARNYRDFTANDD